MTQRHSCCQTPCQHLTRLSQARLSVQRSSTLTHLYELQLAKAQGDFLLVGLHTDEDVSDRRGKHLPIMDVHERSLSVMACRYVNEVVIGQAASPYNVPPLHQSLPRRVFCSDTSPTIVQSQTFCHLLSISLIPQPRRSGLLLAFWGSV